MDVIGSESCLMEGFGISCVNSSEDVSCLASRLDSGILHLRITKKSRAKLCCFVLTVLFCKSFKLSVY